MNRLSKERSIYLKNSAYQKIDWYTWSDEPFERARLEDKPVFLSSGAAWCHWCHVMAKECFENEEIVRLLNENFINVKIDRDERPEIDRRYQLAVQSMGITGGWPLSVFLTPDKKVFYGGTYFPPEDSYGGPGFIKVLSSIVDFYKKNRDKVIQYSEMIMNSLKPIQAYPEKIDKSILDTAIKDIFSNFDPQNGGFGRYPKFPMHGVIEFLINRFHLTKKEELGYVIKTTLDAMAKGGFYDQIGGGFHRYSTDEAWIIPHFEKMAVDNAWLLRNYIDAYQVLGYEYYKEVSLGILNFLKDNLSDPEGGFYSSMDADVIVDDEGGYFTWTDEEFKEVLDKNEYEVMSLHLFHEIGAMHHNRSKRVLFIVMDKEDIPINLERILKQLPNLIKTGKEKLYKKKISGKSP